MEEGGGGEGADFLMTIIWAAGGGGDGAAFLMTITFDAGGGGLLADTTTRFPDIRRRPAFQPASVRAGLASDAPAQRAPACIQRRMPGTPPGCRFLQLLIFEEDS